MATLALRFVKRTPDGMKTVARIEIVGRKMTKTWLRKHYGEDCGGYSALYDCHKNPYGITWVSATTDRYDNVRMDICTDPMKASERLPYYDEVYYTKL